LTESIEISVYYNYTLLLTAVKINNNIKSDIINYDVIKHYTEA